MAINVSDKKTVSRPPAKDPSTGLTAAEQVESQMTAEQIGAKDELSQKGTPPAPKRAQAPAMPQTSVKAPTHYEAGPTVDQVAGGQATLEMGQKGLSVRMMQEALNASGANPKLDTDGYFGPKTLAALQEFQQKAGVKGDQGCAGAETLGAFQKTLSSEQIEGIRNRAIAADAIANGRVGSVGKQDLRGITNERVDQAMREQTWSEGDPQSVGNFKVMSQSNYNDRLGNGSGGQTIRNAGCMLSAYAIASTGITGNQNMDPRKANDLVRNAGGFSGALLVGPTAARALGMKETGRTDVRSAGASNVANRMEQALKNGQAVVLGVNYKGDSKTDHFITVTGSDGKGNFTCIDPAGGRTFTMHAGPNGISGNGWAAGTRYNVNDAIFLSKG